MSSETMSRISSSLISVKAFSAPPSSSGVGHVLFLADQGVDFLLDRAAGDEFVDQDVALLADAEGAVGGLVFDGGVPPAVEVDDVRGGGEVEPGAAGLDREHEERRAVFALEIRHQCLALLDGGAAVQDQAGAPEDVARNSARGSVISRNWVKIERLFAARGDLAAERCEAARTWRWRRGRRLPSPVSWLGWLQICLKRIR